MDKAVWIWYPGDFELYHGMRQNFLREERGFGWPAFWKMDDWRKNVRFFRTYELQKEERIRVRLLGVGYVAVDGRKYASEKELPLSPGVHRIEIFVGNMTGLPAAYAETPGGSEGDGPVCTDGSWMADDFTEMHPVGTSSLCASYEERPDELHYTEERVEPVRVREVNGGTLADFGRMVNGRPEFELKDPGRTFSVLYGESEDEALDFDWCYYKEEQYTAGKILKRRAFRYVFLPEMRPEEVRIRAVHTRIPVRRRASFRSDDAVLNRVWEVAAETYELCGGLFFIDGIKRDRWIWGGDAFQSFLVNPYFYFDREINKRTLRALRGNTSANQHINTIVDYSMLWLISVEQEYLMDGDRAFLAEMFPKMTALADLLLSQRDEQGFIRGRERDWIYIDWAEIDKEGSISAEQILLWKALRAMAFAARTLAAGREMLSGAEREALMKAAGEILKNDISGTSGADAGMSGLTGRSTGLFRDVPVGADGRPLPRDEEMERKAPLSKEERTKLEAAAVFYESAAETLKTAVDTYFWDEEQSAYIDSFASGRRHVTRHANLFAILFDFVNSERAEQILGAVLENEKIPAITTPYFKFFELDAFGKMGRLDRIRDTLYSYWGGMLERGAVTFWEFFDPKEEGKAQYAMYGDPFGKSLCHAWGASPIYLLGKYFLGVRPSAPGYESYEVRPRTEYFRELDCEIPAGDETVHIILHEGELKEERQADNVTREG